MISLGVLGQLVNVSAPATTTPPVPPSACTTVFYTNPNAQNDFSNVSNGNKWGGVITYDPNTSGGGSVTVCAVSLMVKLDSGVDYQASIWTLNGNDLLTQQGSYSNSDTGTGDPLVVIKWIFPSAISLSAGTSYAIVFSRTDGLGFSGNEVIYQGGTNQSYNTGQWNSSQTLNGFASRNPIVTIYQ